jgi:hypothetical protein
MTLGSSTPAQRYSSSSAERIPIHKNMNQSIINKNQSDLLHQHHPNLFVIVILMHHHEDLSVFFDFL